MADRLDRTETNTRLPPPPAPVARDANPWPMPAQQTNTWRSPAPPRFQRPAQPTARPDARPDARPAAASPAPGASTPLASRHGLARWVPFAIVLAVLGSIAASALEALDRGKGITAFVPLLVGVIVAVGAWRNAARRRRD